MAIVPCTGRPAATGGLPSARTSHMSRFIPQPGGDDGNRPVYSPPRGNGRITIRPYDGETPVRLRKM